MPLAGIVADSPTFLRNQPTTTIPRLILSFLQTDKAQTSGCSQRSQDQNQICFLEVWDKLSAIRVKVYWKRMSAIPFGANTCKMRNMLDYDEDRKYFLIPFQKLWLTWEMGIVHAQLEKPIWAKSTIYHDLNEQHFSLILVKDSCPNK